MNSETKTCQNCKTSFIVEPDDFAFYEKMQVPVPTFCSDCRLQRRLAWRNERMLYRRTCDGTKANILAIYPPETKFTVYEQKYWWSDAWDALSYGREYDFSRSFFTQFADLLRSAPLINVFNANSINSDYCNYTVNHKNCYLVSAGWDNEDVIYSNRVLRSKDSGDLYIGVKDEGCYDSVSCKECYRVHFSVLCDGCADSAFLYDCRNCHHCVGCTNLRNKSYCLFNVQYSREEYEKKVKELGIDRYSGIEAMRARFEELKQKTIHRYAQIYKSVNVVGDNVEGAKNCYQCFDLPGEAEDSKYCHWGSFGLRDSFDSGPGAGGNSELIYEGVSSGVKNARLVATVTVWNSHDVQYSVNCHGSSHLFGCVSLKNKQYCIFNKQYSKEEYEALVARIVQHMMDVPYKDAKGNFYRYGEFFPIELSTFAYNESVAQEYFPMRREEIVEAGYLWHDPIEKSHVVIKLSESLPETITEVSDAITSEIIGCAHQGNCSDGCAKAFRITVQELALYRKLNVPLPRLCFNCRHHRRLKQRNPMKLWHRRCMCAGAQSENGVYANTASHFHGSGHCPNEFETSYAPERPEIVYCEACYQNEVA